MKKISMLALAAIILLLSSCITRYVKKDHKSYNEVFYGYYVSRYGNDLVFIGNKFHYVFKDELKQIVEFTKVEWKGKLVIGSINLSVNKDNVVTGYSILDVKVPIGELDSSEISILNRFNFKEKNGIFSKKIDLSGIRYEPSPYSNRDRVNRFKQNYKTHVSYKLSHNEEMKKALVTPIAMTVDGIFIVAGGITIPLLIVAFTE